VGSGGTETWRLAAQRPGAQTLTLEYRRPWEHGVPPARTVSYRVTVN
jgi:inhibitor of cysteine peptidase